MKPTSLSKGARYRWKRILLGLILMVSASDFSQAASFDGIEGPGTVDLAGEVARLEISSDYIFADAAGTRKLMESIGNPVTKLEAGRIAPRNSDKQWYLVFEYNSIGYIKNAARERIDSDGLTKTCPDHAVIPEVYFFMARVLNEKMQNKIKAKQIISWVIKKYPGHKSASMAERYLAALQGSEA